LDPPKDLRRSGMVWSTFGLATSEWFYYKNKNFNNSNRYRTQSNKKTMNKDIEYLKNCISFSIILKIFFANISALLTSWVGFSDQLTDLAIS
jgi:hypothetical protein